VHCPKLITLAGVRAIPCDWVLDEEMVAKEVIVNLYDTRWSVRELVAKYSSSMAEDCCVDLLNP
jgi:hypothetical protein